jgi:glycosyltransferase involved in cell wall biosynthesis
MDKKVFASVVVPCKDSEKTLNNCIKSILSQTEKNFELILVDNNSKDSTKEIIKKFRQKDKRVKYIFESRESRGAARNKGEKISKGKIIMMTDSDCIVQKNWIKNISKPIIEKKAEAVQGMFKPIKENYWTKNYQIEKDRIIKEKIISKGYGFLDTANFAIKNSFLKEIGYSNKKMYSGNDTELEIRIRKSKGNIKIIKERVGHYHPDSFENIIKKNLIRGYWRYKIIKEFDKKNEFLKVSKKEDIKFIIGIIRDLILLRDEFLYNLASGISWRIGLICGFFIKKI